MSKTKDLSIVISLVLTITAVLYLESRAETINVESGSYADDYSGSNDLIKTATDATATLTGTLSYTGTTTVNGGTLLISGTGSALTGNLIVNSGGTLASDNKTSGKKDQDPRFGTGTIYLNDGGALQSYVHPTHISNNIIVNGNVTLNSNGNNKELYLYGNISGAGTITEKLTYSLKLYGDNSNFSGNWVNVADWLWSNSVDSTTQFNGKTFSHPSLGSGSMTFDGAGVANTSGGGIGVSASGVSNYYIDNALIINSTNCLLQGGTSILLNGTITGTGYARFNQQGTPRVYLRGDASGKTGSWSTSRTILNTANTNASETVDSTFGAGTITVQTYYDSNNSAAFAGALEADQSGVFVHNPVQLLNANAANIPEFVPLRTAEGASLTLTGPLTGAATVTRNDKGTLNLCGDGSAFTGSWILKDGTVTTDSTTATGNDARFGSGTITLAGGTLRPAATDKTYINNQIIAAEGTSSRLDNGTNSLTLGKAFSGTGKISIADFDKLVLPDNSAFTGTLVFEAGTISVADTAALTAVFGATGPIGLAGATLSTPITVLDRNIDVSGTTGSTITLAGADTSTLTLNGALTGNGSLKSNAATVNVNGSAENYSGNWALDPETGISTLQSNTEGVSQFGSGTITFGTGAQIVSTAVNTVINNNLNFSTPGLIQLTNESADKTLELGGTLTGARANLPTGMKELFLTGDASGLTGDWVLTAIIATNNTNPTTDAVFETAPIQISAGGAIKAAGEKVYVVPNVTVTDASNTIPFLTPAGTNLVLKGTLAFDPSVAQYTKSDAGTLTLGGNNAALANNWAVSGGTLATDNSIATEADGTTDSRFGAGSITLTGGALGMDGTGLRYIHNNITINAPSDSTARNQLLINPGTNAQGGKSAICLKGQISGAGDVYVSTVGADAATSQDKLGYLRSEPDNSGFSGNWHVQNAKLMATNNSSNSSAGPCFGTGTIYLDGNAAVVCSGVSAGNVRVNNPIVVTGTNYFRSDSNVNNQELYFYGKISGDENATIWTINNGFGYRFVDVADYQGDWYFTNDFCQTLGVTGHAQETSFGTGTVYFKGGGIQNMSQVDNDIQIVAGSYGRFRYGGSPKLNGTVTLQKSTTSTQTNIQLFKDSPVTLQFAKKLQGDGIVESPVKFLPAAILSPGQDNHAIGTLTFTNTVTMAAGSIIELDFDTYSCDQIVAPSLNLSGVTINASFTDDFIENLDWNSIALKDLPFANTTNGTATWDDATTFISNLTLPDHAWLELAFRPNGSFSLRLNNSTNVPEPSTALLLILGLLALYPLRRRVYRSLRQECRRFQ